MSQEDELAKDALASDYYDECRLEVPYNHYGTRGVVDFVGIEDPEGVRGRNVTVKEYKSESAVRNATGANEIIRQFNRQTEYFGEHEDFGRHSDYTTHCLVFYATQYTIDHVLENFELYRNVMDTADRVTVSLTHPKAESPFILPTEGLTYQPGCEPAIEAEGIDTTDLIHVSELGEDE